MTGNEVQGIILNCLTIHIKNMMQFGAEQFF